MGLLGVGVFAEQLNGMREDRKDKAQIFHRTPGAPGQVDDERPATNACHGAGKHGMTGFLERSSPHDLRETRRIFLNDSPSRFGGDIARRKAGTSRREDDVHFAAIRPFDQRLAKR